MPGRNLGASYVREYQPIYAAIADQLGYTSEEVTAAVNRRRVTIYHDCLAAAGYVAPRASLAPMVNLPSALTSPVDRLREQILSTEATKGLPKIPESAFIACDPQVDQLNPSLQLVTMVEGAVKESMSRVESDPQVLAAQKELARCQKSAAPERGPRQMIAAQVGRVEAAFNSGSMTTDAALAELDKLSDVAKTVDWTVDSGCEERYYGVLRTVINVQQAKFLTENPGFPAAIAEKYRPLIRDLFTGDHPTTTGN